MDVNIGNNNKIILITNNNYAKDLTIKFIDYWNKQKSITDLKIFDINDFTISNIGNNLVKKYNDKDLILKTIDDFNVSSYPAFLIFNNSTLIECIFGSYDNILEILNIYI
jgi:hypothetical protein